MTVMIPRSRQVEEATDRQCEILETDRNVVVLGRPGSGKTTVALWKALKFITEHPLEDHQRVLFLSFSRAATQRIVDAAKLSLSRRTRAHFRISTFHRFCYDILRSHCQHLGLSSPFKVVSPSERRILKHADPGALQQRLFDIEDQESRVSLDRFAELTADLLEGNDALLKAYSGAFPLVIVDEYQDSDDDQDRLTQLFARRSQVICLGDPDQRIYDFRPGISARRMQELEGRGFQPIELELINHRSAGAGVLEFARAILSHEPSVPRGAVSIRGVGRKHEHLFKAICESVVSLRRRSRRELWRTRGYPEIAVMLPTNHFVEVVSRALREPPAPFQHPFPHNILVDGVEIAAALDVVFSLLESADHSNPVAAAGEIVRQLCQFERCRPKGGRKTQADRLETWSIELAQGAVPTRSPVCKSLLGELSGLSAQINGDPQHDFAVARGLLGRLGGGYADKCIECLDFGLSGVLGDKVASALGDLYEQSCSYEGAVRVGQRAVLAEQLAEGQREPSPLTLMTLHKCKGREYDAVVIAETSRPPNRFTVRGEGKAEPRPRSRRLLHVAVTRARHAVIILTPGWDRSPLLPKVVSPH